MKKIILLIIVSFGYHFSYAQSEEAAVQEAIETMFNGMRAGDSAIVHSVFSDKAIMQTVVKNQGGVVDLRDGSLQNFLKTVGTPHDKVYDERILSYEIKIDGDMASAWTPYEFYLGDQFSHKGVNSFQLAKLNGQWKVIYIVDTRRR